MLRQHRIVNQALISETEDTTGLNLDLVKPELERTIIHPSNISAYPQSGAGAYPREAGCTLDGSPVYL